jgi:serine/threonine protein phosphatase PrpC
MKFSVFQVSRQGGREKNEDRMGYCYTRDSAVFLLADGMGGHPQGEVAAQIALQEIAAMFQKEARPDLEDVKLFLTMAVMAAHRRILHYGLERALLDSPRTTLVVAIVQAGAMTWTHCGDSRLYLLRQGDLVARTRDHSMMERDAAKEPSAKLDERPNRNVLYTCLGGPIKPIFKITGPVTLQQGDRVMLCSDGLWSSLSESEIVVELSSHPVDLAVPHLVESALRSGGKSGDNVTCIALEWETPDVFPSTRGSISTDVISEGGYESTLRADLFDPETDELDDETIERSIAEINEAIRRTALKKARTSMTKAPQ